MENTSGFVLGLLAFIASIVFLFAPAMVSLGLLAFLGILCIIININMCILIMMGGIWNSRSLSGTGFGVGMGTWAGLIIIAILSIIGLQQIIGSATLGLMMMILLDFGGGFFEIFFIAMQMSTISFLRRGLTWNIIQIVITAICLIFGSISFGLVVGHEKF